MFAIVFVFNCRVNGHDANSAHTFGMIAGYLHAGRGLGAILGPVTVGALTDKIDLPWAMTVLSGLNTVFVSSGCLCDLHLFIYYYLSIHVSHTNTRHRRQLQSQLQRQQR